jgi:hypothetical protein
MISDEGEHMKITEFGAGLRVYQAQQQASFVKNLLSGSKNSQNNIFTKMNSDVFTYEPSFMTDLIKMRFDAEIAKTKKTDTSNLPENTETAPTGQSGLIDAADSKIAIRKEKNADIEKLLSENGIKISDGEKFSFSVDSKTLNVTVSGENAEKAKQIETVLSNNKYGKEIISAANQASLKQEEIASHIQMRKYNANLNMQYKFGCSLDEITFDKNGTPYLPNGQSVAAAVSGGAETGAMLASGNITARSLGIASIEAVLRPLRDIYSAGGADAISDFTVNIDYDKNGYIDTMTEYGFGTDQMGWYDKLKSLQNDIPALLAYGNTLFT